MQIDPGKGNTAAINAEDRVRSRRLRSLCQTAVLSLRRPLGILALTALVAFASSQVVLTQKLHLDRPPDIKAGKKIYEGGCIACHGSDGNGAPQTMTEFKRPETFPDFSACDQTTAEPDSNWKAVIVHGGPHRGFSQIMPAFDYILKSDQIDDVIAYLRGFCNPAHWPRGQLNLPRAIVTEKAFPESEEVVTHSVNASGAPGFQSDIIHEERFGVKNQIEVDVPIHAEDQDHQWTAGIGDITLGLKRVLWSSLEKGSIVAVQGSVIPPTGDSKRGFGSGTTTFETFVAADQLFPTNTFVQFQAGADLPVDPSVSPQNVFTHTAIGQAISGDHRLGRLWTPMVEFLSARDITDTAKTDWDILPQFQVTVSPRQHVRAAIGVRAPLNNTANRSSSVDFYLLWDWADGKLWEGW